MAFGADNSTTRAFDAEVARLRAAGVPAAAGRLRELFDYLADRGFDAPPATQADIADAVFRHVDVGGDDATVRVYIHRLRKRLDEHYAGREDGSARLTVPPGAYVLRLANGEAEPALPVEGAPRWRWPWAWIAAGAVLLLAGFLAGRWLAPSEPAANAIWQPFLASKRPLTIVVGDYYLYGEIDPIKPERSRLIRDFSVNSPADLALAQQAEPARYGAGEDVGLNYLPFSSAYALKAVSPVLAEQHRPIRVLAASQLDADTLRNDDIVYVGLLSGLGMLEDLTFAHSNFAVGDSYDELDDTKAGKSYVSDEARQLVTSMMYKDYAYVARYRSPSGGLVAIVAGTRETGLRGLSSIVGGKLPPQLERVAKGGGDFEAVFEVAGQRGADLSRNLLAARPRK